METQLNYSIKKSYALITIALISCSMLMYEILLTRICALRLFFHFGFLVVSNCLLGIGASGSIIAILQDTFAKRERFWIWLFSILYLIALIIVYIFLLTYSIPVNINFLSLQHMLRFSIFNLVAAIPFFFSGCIIGLILTFNAQNVNKIYCLDLLGAGLGCLLIPFFLWQTGAGGCFVFLALLALSGVFVATPTPYKRIVFIIGGLAGLLGLSILPKLDAWFPVPSKVNIKVTENSLFVVRGNILSSRWIGRDHGS